jgi:SAM-dependent methyltransferase
MNKEKTQNIVKEAYGKIAQGQSGCGCGCDYANDAQDFAKTIGYSEDELKGIPSEANLALSCGNPTAIASLKSGETVLDLGSGAGFDCFLAASKVGATGKVIGVDMTPEMIEKAKMNAQNNHIKNVEFRLGEIENLPLDANSVDVVISNCVINLSADKAQVAKEMFRVLKKDGRIAISDIALLKPLPPKIRKSIDAYVGCVSGAVLIAEYKKMLEDAEFKNIQITVKGNSSCISSDTKDPMGQAILSSLKPDESLDSYIASVIIKGGK